MRITKDPIALLAGLGAGAIILYLLDPKRRDKQLVRRVRDELGHTVDRTRTVQVFAEDGCVTLSGAVAPDEILDTLETAASVPGVRTVDNQLFTQSQR